MYFLSSFLPSLGDLVRDGITLGASARTVTQGYTVRLTGTNAGTSLASTEAPAQTK